MTNSIEKRIAAQTEHLPREELVRLLTNYATELGDVKTILGEVLPLESSAENYAIRAREEIAALRAATERIERLERALRPFAAIVPVHDASPADVYVVASRDAILYAGASKNYVESWMGVSAGDLRRAAAALSPQEPA